MAPLARFYLSGAGGAALRNAVAAGIALVLSLVLVPDAEVVLLRLGLSLVSSEGNWSLRFPFGLVAFAVAIRSGPVLRLGFAGWLRSLPYAAGSHHRRAMAVALLLPQAFLIAALAASVVAAVASGPAAIDPVRVTGSFITLAGAAMAGVPVRRRVAGLAIGGLVGLGGIVANLVALLFGAGAAVAWDRLAGSVAVTRPSPRWSSSGRLLPLVLTWRALGPAVIAALAPALVLIAIGYLFRTNNRLPEAVALASARVVTGLGLVTTLGLLGDRLARVRPIWPWSRSLPMSSWRRTGTDAVALATIAVVVLIGAGGLDWRAAILGSVLVPPLGLFAVECHRRSAGRHLLVSGRVIPLGGVAVTAAGLWPVLAWPIALATPWLWWRAARADRRLVVTRWNELHYSAEGDSQAAADR